MNDVSAEENEQVEQASETVAQLWRDLLQGLSEPFSKVLAEVAPGHEDDDAPQEKGDQRILCQAQENVEEEAAENRLRSLASRGGAAAGGCASPHCSCCGGERAQRAMPAGVHDVGAVVCLLVG